MSTPTETQEEQPINNYPNTDHLDHHDDDDEEPKHANPIMRFLIAESWTDGTLEGLKDDLLAGITLTLTNVPPSVAFAIMAKMNPLTGLYTSFFVGVICAVFGGRPGSVSAAAGALAVAYPEIVEPHGPEALFAASILSGLFMTIPGIIGIVKYVRMLPSPVMVGFVNGLAIVLFRGQIDAFKDPSGEYVTGDKAGYTVMLCLISFLIIFIMPYFTKIIPSAFVAIFVCTILEHAIGLGTVTIGDLYTLNGNFPTPKIPDIDYADGALVGDVVIMAVIIAIIGMVESLLTVHLLNVLTETHGNFERESLALGSANIVSGFFRGFAGCAVIGMCVLNFGCGGGRRRLSAFITGVFMIIVVLAIYPAINWLPMGALSAVLFAISIKTFDWRTWEMIFMLKIPLADSIVILVVAIVTVFTDLAVAVAAGVGCSMLFFVWDMSQGRIKIEVDEEVDEDLDIHARVLHIKGVLFFASCPEFFNQIEALHENGEDAGDDVVIDFGNGRCTVHDFSAVDTLQQLASMYSRHKRRLHIRNLDGVSAKLVDNALQFAPDVHEEGPEASLTKRIVLTRVKPPAVKHSPMSPASPAIADTPQADRHVPFPPSADIPANTKPEELEAIMIKRTALLRDLRCSVYAHSLKLKINVPVSMTLEGWQKWKCGHRHTEIERHVTFTKAQFDNLLHKGGQPMDKKEMEIAKAAILEIVDPADSACVEMQSQQQSEEQQPIVITTANDDHHEPEESPKPDEKPSTAPPSPVEEEEPKAENVDTTVAPTEGETSQENEN